MTPLTDTQREMLEFERLHWKFAGAKDAAIRERWDISPTRYYQLLGAALDEPAALEYDAQLVHRLVRLREKRRGVRRAG